MAVSTSKLVRLCSCVWAPAAEEAASVGGKSTLMQLVQARNLETQRKAPRDAQRGGEGAVRLPKLSWEQGTRLAATEQRRWEGSRTDRDKFIEGRFVLLLGVAVNQERRVVGRGNALQIIGGNGTGFATTLHSVSAHHPTPVSEKQEVQRCYPVYCALPVSPTRPGRFDAEMDLQPVGFLIRYTVTNAWQWNVRATEELGENIVGAIAGTKRYSEWRGHILSESSAVRTKKCPRGKHTKKLLGPQQQRHPATSPNQRTSLERVSDSRKCKKTKIRSARD